MKAFTDVVNTLDLTNIESVGECKFLTIFQTSVILSFVGDAENATQQELDALGASFIETYNRINSGDAVCDRQFRRLSQFRVEGNITLNDEFLEQGGLYIDDEINSTAVPGGERRILTKTQIKRRDQSLIVPDVTSSPTTATPKNTGKMSVLAKRIVVSR